jgi:hypothetical protein
MAEPNRKLSEVIWKSTKATLQVVIAEMKEFDPNKTPFLACALSRAADESRGQANGVSLENDGFKE